MFVLSPVGPTFDLETKKSFLCRVSDKDLWKFCLDSYKVRLKVLNMKLRSSERFKDSLSTKTLFMSFHE